MHALLLLSNTFFSVCENDIIFPLRSININYTARSASIEPSVCSQSKTHIGFIIFFLNAAGSIC